MMRMSIIVFEIFLALLSTAMAIKYCSDWGGLLGAFVLMAWMLVIGATDDFLKANYKNKKRRRMPRIYRFIFYGLLLSLLWKLVANIEGITMFLVNRFL